MQWGRIGLTVDPEGFASPASRATRIHHVWIVGGHLDRLERLADRRGTPSGLDRDRTSSPPDVYDARVGACKVQRVERCDGRLLVGHRVTDIGWQTTRGPRRLRRTTRTPPPSIRQHRDPARVRTRALAVERRTVRRSSPRARTRLAGGRRGTARSPSHSAVGRYAVLDRDADGAGNSAVTADVDVLCA